MSDTGDRYRRLSQRFADTVAAAAAVDRWSDQSPCPDWTARDVVGHVVGTQGMFLGFIGRQLDDGPSVDDDPAAAWDHARAAVQAELDDPERAGTTFEGSLGKSTFEEAVDRFLCTDLVIHRWDLARAIGQEVQLDPADMDHSRQAMAPLVDKMRAPRAFGSELEVPPGADEQTTFLAFVGRRA